MQISKAANIASVRIIPTLKAEMIKCLQQSQSVPVVHKLVESNAFIKVLDKLSIPLHPYIQKVSSKFYRGSHIKPEDIQTIAQKGINVVISLKAETAKNMKNLSSAYKKYGIEYINVPLNPFSESEENVGKIIDILQQRSDKSIYVHCSFGKDRTGLVTALYRTIFENWNPEKALSEMREFGYRENMFPQLKSVFERITKKFNLEKQAA